MPASTRFLSAPSADTRSATIVAALFVGAVSGINMVIIENALAAVVFSGPAEQFLLQGIGLFLFGSAVICFVVALTSGYEGALSAPPVSTTMTLPAIVTTIAASGAGAVPDHSRGAHCSRRRFRTVLPPRRSFSPCQPHAVHSLSGGLRIPGGDGGRCVRRRALVDGLETRSHHPVRADGSCFALEMGSGIAVCRITLSCNKVFKKCPLVPGEFRVSNSAISFVFGNSPASRFPKPSNRDCFSEE